MTSVGHSEANDPGAWVPVDEAGRRALRLARSRTLWQALSDATALDRQRTALVAADDDGGIQRLSYAQLLARVRNCSAGLASIGVQRGDRVALWMTNRLEWIISSYAAARLGAAVVPVNTFLKAPEVGYCLKQSGARHLILLDRFRKLDLTQMLGEICPAFAQGAPAGELCSSQLPDLRNVVVLSRTGIAAAGAYDWSALEAVSRTQEEWLLRADEMMQATSADDLIMIKYTSGSTGFPKGVMLQQGGFVANGILHGRRTGMRREDIYFSMMPFFHAGGSIYGQMSMLPIGGTLVFTEAFSTELAIKLLQQEQPTIFVSVLSKEVVMEAHQRGLSFPSIRIGHAHNDAARKVLPNATFSFTPYGLTETYGPAAITSPSDSPDKLTSTCGRPLEGNEIRVVDPRTGRDLACGEVGEAWIRGNLMLGYWNLPEETARAIDCDGWLRSEDLVSVDTQGFIRYCGRIKLMAKVGGENVSLEEVEAAVKGHEAVQHCAAVAVADLRKIEAVRIYVVARADLPVSESELLRWLRPRLAHFKLPREVLFVDDLPRLANGKLNRLVLSEWAKISPP